MEDELTTLSFHKLAAPAFHAMVVYIEHQYYGRSVPFGSAEEAYKDGSKLGYLTVSQALADYAEVVVFIQKEYDAPGPVIAIGCSYGGMLSAYFRLKYPHIVRGALSSSAPVNYVNGDVSSQSKYYETISSLFMDTSITCYIQITLSWGKIDELYRKEGVDGLTRIIPPCSPFGTADPLKNYLRWQYSSFAMYDRPGSSQVRSFCNAVEKIPEGASTLEKIRAGLDAVFNHPKCFEIPSDLDQGQLPAPASNLRGWDWQTCTEIVLPIGSKDGPGSMFDNNPFSIQSQNDYCEQRYHVKPRVKWMATTYNITPEALANFGSNIIFSNGLRDPYSNGGVLQNISPSIVALSTEEGSHCLDVIYPLPDDPKWLDDMRAQELKVVESWFKLSSPNVTTYHF